MKMVNVTEKAASEVKKIIAEQNLSAETMLRVGVSGGGCSGFSYSLTFDTKSDDMADDIYECHGIRVVVDRKSDLYLDGTAVDFYDGLEKRGFVFNNPNATKSCGCGSSFST
jgi:iron-sulfur cluster assembly protein